MNLNKILDAKTPSFNLDNSCDVLTNNHIDFLKKFVNSKRTIARIVLNSSKYELIQSMVICQHALHRLLPHYHENIDEYYQILEGKIAVLEFSKNGTIDFISILSPKKNIVKRMLAKKTHSVLSLSSKAIFVEYRSGPFEKKSDAIYPDFKLCFDDIIKTIDENRLSGFKDKR